MALDLARLSDLANRHGAVARIVVASLKASGPREVGAAMLVWDKGQDGTIGGGALEFAAVATARQRLGTTEPLLAHVPLGPALGQCCGGVVTLLTEVYTAKDCAALSPQANRGLPHCRPVDRATSGGVPLAVARIIDRARARGTPTEPQFQSGWMIEPFTSPRPPLWIYGAGHVGRALVTTLAPLGFDMCWIDTDHNRFPANMPKDITQLVAANPALVVTHAPDDAHHLVLTFSHALDLEICHRILSRRFRSAGLIGSATKWARFAKRLAALGHTERQINRITCPIGLPALGKAPAAIALGVATRLLMDNSALKSSRTPVKETAI